MQSAFSPCRHHCRTAVARAAAANFHRGIFLSGNLDISGEIRTSAGKYSRARQRRAAAVE
jgi:hypothetical protein